jgi:hypothetical protein
MLQKVAREGRKAAVASLRSVPSPRCGSGPTATAALRPHCEGKEAIKGTFGPAKRLTPLTASFLRDKRPLWRTLLFQPVGMKPRRRMDTHHLCRALRDDELVRQLSLDMDDVAGTRVDGFGAGREACRARVDHPDLGSAWYRRRSRGPRSRIPWDRPPSRRGYGRGPARVSSPAGRTGRACGSATGMWGGSRPSASAQSRKRRACASLRARLRRRRCRSAEDRPGRR